MSSLFDPILQPAVHALEQSLISLAFAAGVWLFCGLSFAYGLRARNLRWTWAGVPLAPSLLLSKVSFSLGLAAVGVCLLAGIIGVIRYSKDVASGGDIARGAKERLGVLAGIELLVERWKEVTEGVRWTERDRLTVGFDEWGRHVRIAAPLFKGAHTLVVGATGSGKTCTQAWIASRMIERGLGAVVVDPKGDDALRDELLAAAQRAKRPFVEWTPRGPHAYNPYAHGGSTEIADKALISETFTEPHYQRLAQRYLEHATRSMLAAGIQITPVSLMAHMDPRQLEETARAAAERQEMGPEGADRAGCPEDADQATRYEAAEKARQTEEYVQSLTERQKRDLAGVRDRLSILAESDVARWLDPARAEQTIDLAAAVRRGAVVYFALDADRRPLLAQMLGGAIVADLVTIAAAHQEDPLPTVVSIDEFSAVASELVARLFSRGRGAGFSLMLATQEMADLSSVGRGAAVGKGSLRDSVIGNLATTIAFRQNVPESAELISQLAGMKPGWITTQRTRGPLPAGLFPRGTRRRGLEPTVEADRIKKLAIGEALVIDHAGGAPATFARMCHPSQARQPNGERRSETSRPIRLEAPHAIR